MQPIRFRSLRFRRDDGSHHSSSEQASVSLSVSVRIGGRARVPRLTLRPAKAGAVSGCSPRKSIDSYAILGDYPP